MREEKTYDSASNPEDRYVDDSQEDVARRGEV